MMTIPDSDKIYTYSDYLNFPENERWEIIDGVPYMLSAPSWEHQAISGELYAQLHSQLKAVRSSCMVFASPFDLRLPYKNEKDENTTFVSQPDILIICNKTGLKGTGFYGVPIFIIEISSPSTVKIDKTKKLDKYEKSGVKEYWIVEPESKTVSVFVLHPDYKIYGKPEYYFENDKIRLKSLENVEIDLDVVFDSVK